MFAPHFLMAETMPRKIAIDLFHIPKQLSPRILGSASDFIITQQCLRNLVRIDTSGQLSGDLAVSWTVSSDKMKFAFKIRKGEKFSNGEAITSDDVISSLNHPDYRKIAIHFDFATIRAIKAVGDTVEVTLSEPNFNFIYHLTQPEFGVFHKSDRTAIMPSLKISSGPYHLVSANEQRIVLERNPHTKDFGPEQLEFVALSEKKFAALEAGLIDMALLWEDPSTEEMGRFSKSGRFDVLRPHVGFTFWMTLNPASPNMKELAYRRWLQSVLKRKFDSHFSPTTSWDRAYQLFLPDGPGRASRNWTDEFWAQKVTEPAATPEKLKVLVSSRFQFKAELRRALADTASSTGTSIEFSEYADQTEFMNKLKANVWDMYLINNDFSSYELVKNLVVTFNRDKSLIPLQEGDQELRGLWADIQKSDVADQRYSKLELLAKMLLQKALFVPLAYKNVPIIKRKEIDLSGWSTLFPEFAFWKVRIDKRKSGP